MTEIDNILYSPIEPQLDWRHLWEDLDQYNKKLVRTVLDNLRFIYDNYRHRFPDRHIIDAAALMTAHVLPRLLAHHVTCVQPLIAEKGRVCRLEHEKDVSGIRLSLRAHVVEAHRRNLSIILRDGIVDNMSLTSIANEAILELDQDLLRALRNLPDTPTDKNTFDVPVILNAHTVQEEYAALPVLISRQSAYIATNTRRARGNWAVVSPIALQIIEAAAGSWFTRPSAGNFEPLPNENYVGMLGNYMRIFCDRYADDSTPVLVGYKGDSNFDGGTIWSPYSTVEPRGLVVDPNTFETYQSFHTRYGYLERTAIDKWDQVNESKNWFGLVGMNAPLPHSFL